MQIQIMWAEGADQTLGLPEYETSGAAGADLRANLPDRGEIRIVPGARALIPTGLHMAIPVGGEVQIRPRSGLALKHGVSILNAPGTIDSDYRGPVGVILINMGQTPYLVHHGARIAQMVVAPVCRALFSQCARLGETVRGGGGFGSTGSQ